MSCPESDPALRQFNLGERSRIAGRDYYESRIPDSIKVYLATTPSDRLDEEASDNERLFYYRFGVDVPRAAREQVLALKRQHGFTDAECRWLRRSGQFRINREGAKLMPDRLVPAAAWFYGLTLAFFFASSLLIINLSAVAPWKQSLGSAVILALWLGTIWIINRLFWAPWRWIRKLQRPA
jgi:hypothetical protein